MENRFNDDETKYIMEEVDILRNKLTHQIHKDTLSLAARLFHEINNSNRSIPDFDKSAVLDLLDRMLQQKPLSELEDLEGEWEKCGNCLIHKRYFYFMKKKEEDGSIRYFDDSRIEVIDLDGKLCTSLGPAYDIIDDQFPIHAPYYPPTKPYKVFISQIGTDYEAIHKIITPLEVTVTGNKAFKKVGDKFESIKFKEYVKKYWEDQVE